MNYSIPTEKKKIKLKSTYFYSSHSHSRARNTNTETKLSRIISPFVSYTRTWGKHRQSLLDARPDMKSPLHSARLLHLRKGEIFSAIGLNSHKRARLIGRCWLAGNQTSGKLDIAVSHHRLHLAFWWHRIYLFFFSTYIYAKVFARSFVK